MGRRATIPEGPAGTVQGVDVRLRDDTVDEKTVASFDTDSVSITVDTTVTGDINADSVNATTAVNVGGGTSLREIESGKVKNTASQSTYSTEMQNGLGRVNVMLNAEGVSTLTFAEDATRYRTHPGASTVYYGDSSGKIPGDAVTWEQVVNLVMTPTGHTLIMSGDIDADDIDADVFTAAQSVVTPTVQQTTTGTTTAHNISAQQTSTGLAIHQNVYTNEGVFAGVIYTIRGTNGAFFRFDPVINGVQQTGLLTVGTSTTANVGIGTTSPAEKLDVNGRVKSTGWVPVQKAAASSVEGEVFRDTADGLLKEKRGGVIRTFTTTP